MTLHLDIKPTETNKSAPAAMHIVGGLPGFVWAANYEPCVVCSEPCTWVDLSFECRLHPGRCSQQMQDEFQWAEVASFLNSPEYRALVEGPRMMRCPNKNCRPPRYCGLCNGTGQIPD